MGRSARRKSTPSSPAKLQITTTSPRQTRRSNQTLGGGTGNVAHTSNINQDRRLQPISENEDLVAAKSLSRPKRVSKLTSNASIDFDEAEGSSESVESTSQSSDSDELAKLDKDLIIDNLEAINQDAQNLLSLFKSIPVSNISKEIQNPASKDSRRFQNFLRRLRTDTEPCGRGPRIFLPISRLLRVLTDQNLSTSGAEPILLRANLAIFAATLANESLGGKSDQTSELLQYFTLPNLFPYTFFGQHEDIDSFQNEFEGATLALGISILTQLFIDSAEKSQGHADFDPEMLLQTVFLDEDGNPRDMSLRSDSPETVDSLRESIERRMLQVQKHISQKASRPVDIPALRKKFKWKSFVEQSIWWAILRDEQLGEEISEYGGAEAIRSDLEAGPGTAEPRPKENQGLSEREKDEIALEEGTEFLRALDDRLAAADEEEDDKAESDLSSESREHEDNEEDHHIQGVQGTETLSARHGARTRRRHQETIPESPQTQSQQPDAFLKQHDEQELDQSVAFNDLQDGLQAEHDVPDSAQAPRPTQETLDVLGVTQHQERESNKENKPPRQRLRLTDPQPNAERIHFDDESQNNNQHRTKRQRDEETNSEDEDDFEQDRRKAKKARPAVGRGVASSRHRQNSPLFVTDEDEERDRQYGGVSAGNRPAATNRHSRTPSVRPKSSSARPHTNLNNDNLAATFTTSSQRSRSHAAPPASYEEYEQVKQKAQQNIRIASLVAASSSAGQSFKPTQLRRAWTGDEIQRLIDLMREYGTSWAKIKEADSNFAVPLLENRSQVQLKDKARNMKLDFLKAEQPLPDYFDGVTISKSHKEQLRRMNIGLPRDAPEEGRA